MTTELARRNSIDVFEERLKEQPNQMRKEDAPVRHFVTANGLYAREMFIPAGSVITGEIKKHEHLSVISAGFVTEATNDGLQRIKAPYTMISKPGTKRIVWAHTDVVWTTIHSVGESGADSIEELEDYLIARTYQDVPGLTQQLELEV